MSSSRRDRNAVRPRASKRPRTNRRSGARPPAGASRKATRIAGPPKRPRAPSGAPCRDTRGRRPFSGSRLAIPEPSETPFHAAAAARFGRKVRLDRRPEVPVAIAPPDLLQRLPVEIAEDDAVIMRGDPRCDAAWEDVAVHGDVDKAPRTPALTPRPVIVRRRQADLRR